MAVPKGKISRQRRDKRRSAHWKLDLPNVSKCPKCGAPVLSHRACKACGTYRGRQIVSVSEAD